MSLWRGGLSVGVLSSALSPHQHCATSQFNFIPSSSYPAARLLHAEGAPLGLTQELALGQLGSNVLGKDHVPAQGVGRAVVYAHVPPRSKTSRYRPIEQLGPGGVPCAARKRART